MRDVLFICSFLLAGWCSGQSLSGGSGGTGGNGGSGALLKLIAGGATVLVHPEYFMNDEPVAHSRDIETRLFAGLGINVRSATLDSSSGPGRTGVLPWPGISTELGASFTYRDRFMLSVNGAWTANGHLLRVDTMLQSLYHSHRNAELRIAWHTLPQRNVTRQWSFGLGVGWSIQQADVRTTERDGFRSLTVASQAVRPYIAPELGHFTASGRDRYELSVRWVEHLDAGPAWTGVSTYNGTRAIWHGSNDHLAMMMRYHLGFKKHDAPVPAGALPSSPSTLDTIPSLACKRQRITLKLWDAAEMDGDTVSVLLNGEPALLAHCLEHKPVKLRLDLEYGHNEVHVVAHNEGRIAPNTARGILRRGKGREQLLLKTTRTHGEMLVIVRG